MFLLELGYLLVDEDRALISTLNNSIAFLLPWKYLRLFRVCKIIPVAVQYGCTAVWITVPYRTVPYRTVPSASENFSIRYSIQSNRNRQWAVIIRPYTVYSTVCSPRKIDLSHIQVYIHSNTPSFYFLSGYGRHIHWNDSTTWYRLELQTYCCLQNSWHSCEIDQNVHFHLFSLFLNAQTLIFNKFCRFGM